MSAILRSATADDANDVGRVLRSSRLRFMPYAPPAHSETEDLQWARHSLIPSGGVTVASIDGSIVGVLAVRQARHAAWIDQLYVQPEFCGRGVGTQLLTAALSSLRRPVRLYTFQQNTRARAFYEAFGFRALELGDGSTNEERCPDVLYELAGGVDGGLGGRWRRLLKRMKIIGLDHIVLCVQDIDRTIAFYRDFLGMEPRQVRPGKWSLHFGANKISLQDATTSPDIARDTVPGTGNFCVLTDTPVDQFAAVLRDRGIDIVAGQFPSEAFAFAPYDLTIASSTRRITSNHWRGCTWQLWKRTIRPATSRRESWRPSGLPD